MKRAEIAVVGGVLGASLFCLGIECAQERTPGDLRVSRLVLNGPGDIARMCIRMSEDGSDLVVVPISESGVEGRPVATVSTKGGLRLSDENGRAWFEVRSGESSTTMRLGGGAEYGAEFVCNEKSASMQIGGADGASAFIEADDQRGRVAFGVRGSAGSVETMVDKELGHGVIIRDAARRTRGFIGASGGETTSVGVTMQQYADKSSKSPNAVVTLTADRSGTARCAVGGATERDVELSAGADASAVVTNGKDGGVSLRARADRSEIIVDGPGSSGWRGEWTLTDRIMKLVGRRKDGKWSAFEMVFDDVLRVIFRAMDGRKNEILWPDK